MGDLYGFGSMAMPDVARLMQQALGISWRVRESSYRCGEYYLHRGLTDDEELVIQRNCVESEGELAEPSFPDQEVIMYVSSTRWQQLEDAISRTMGDRVSLLRRKAVG